MKEESQDYIKQLLDRNVAIERGEVAASRAHTLEKLPDGTFKYTELDPERRRQDRARAYASKNQISKLRHQFNLSQKAFAKTLNISVFTLRNWESEKTQPSGPAKTLLKIIAARPDVIDVLSPDSNTQSAAH